MNFYNMLHGINPFSKIFLEMLDYKIEDIPRFRDISIKKDEENYIISVFTRTGGGNRECFCYDSYMIDENTSKERIHKDNNGKEHLFGCYPYQNEQLTKNPNYVRDYDDDFDSTYAYFEFRVPDKFKKLCEFILSLSKLAKGDQRTLKEKSDHVIEEIQKSTKEQIEERYPFIKELFGKIEQSFENQESDRVKT